MDATPGERQNTALCLFAPLVSRKTSAYLYIEGRMPPGSQWRAVADGQDVRVWDLETDVCMQTLRGHTAQVNSVAWSPHGKQLAAGAADGTVRVWDTGTWESVQMLRVCAGPVADVSWHNKNYIVCQAHDGTLHAWDTETWQCIVTSEEGESAESHATRDRMPCLITAPLEEISGGELIRRGVAIHIPADLVCTDAKKARKKFGRANRRRA